MSLFLIILFVSLVVVVLVGAFLQGSSGCGGDCVQGRCECNCKDEENGN